MKEPILKVIQLLRSSPFGIEGSYLLGFRFQLFTPSLPIPTAEFRFNGLTSNLDMISLMFKDK
jgi:hypothetical protein